MVKLTENLVKKREDLERAFHKVETLKTEEEKAKLLSLDVSTLMTEVRTICDELEAIVADDYWPLPKYREMLFLSLN
jgi:glutamine synthetase type III